VLLEVEQNWQEYDVLCIDAPVASGKSLISIIIADWQNAHKNSAAILTPKAMLQDQYQRDFPSILSLKGKHKYLCEKCEKNGYKSCGEFHDVSDFYWDTCPYPKLVSEAMDADQVILNFHSHLFNGMSRDMYKDTLIIDEAHNLVPMLSDIYKLTIWEHKEPESANLHTKDDIILWLSDKIEELDKEVKRLRAIYGRDKKKMGKTVRKKVMDSVRSLLRYKMIKEGLSAPQELFSIARKEAVYGRSRKRQTCLEVQPISLKTVPHQMWPDQEVKKLVLLSATMYDKDIDRLGLARKRVKYIKCESPIGADNRPIVIAPVASMSYNELKTSVPVVSNNIQRVADHHSGKGIVHITYGLVYHFKKYLKGDRYIWHTEETREEAYKEFIASKGNKILMACGMSEGIDLAGSEFEWQVIAKAIFPSLSDHLQRHFLERDPLVYTLETVRTTVQQTGRICRTPTDYGITYILDKSFASFYRRSTMLPDGKRIRNFELFPEYFREAMKWEKIT
jgi:Rad3-related DNA helicase